MATTILQNVNGESFDASTLFTCLSCSIAFPSAEDQRAHYRSDHHRYNMKRRVASLPPVTAAVFNQKVLERREETAVAPSSKDTTCSICNKSYATENAYKSHINSKRHKEAELKHNSPSKQDNKEESNQVAKPSTDSKPSKIPAIQESPSAPVDDVEMTIEQKLAAARTRLTTSDCLFCPHKSDSLPTNLEHMSITHGFFIPDAEYLVDIAGLITYLGEKIAVGNVCIYCYGRKRKNPNVKGKRTPEETQDESEAGREFRSLEATRRHMVDKAHCKLAYETEDERLELSDYYDFSSSYPTLPKSKRSKKKVVQDEEWEDVAANSDEEADEVVDESESDASDEEEEEANGPKFRYGDSPYELVLPSGARIGHRSLRHYYKQTYRFSPQTEQPSEEDPKSGAALVRHLLSQKNSALVPRRGGFGAFGEGGEVVKARNPGEAKDAGRHVKEFRDVKRREDFKTKVGFIANNQKHYRDPLLQ